MKGIYKIFTQNETICCCQNTDLKFKYHISQFHDCVPNVKQNIVQLKTELNALQWMHVIPL